MSLSVIVPAAGFGRRFREKGYQDPKPLIRFHGKTMIEHVLENIRPRQRHSVTVVCRREDYERLKFLQVDRLVSVEPTEGAACTVLKACEGLNDYDPLMVANSDQLLDWESEDFLLIAEGYQGCVALFPGDGTKKWSYAKVGEDRLISKIAEKDPISEWATCGVYWWDSVGRFKRAAQRMIQANDRVNGEFYIAPIFNRIERVRGYKVRGMTGLGTPEDLERYVGGIAGVENTHDGAGRAGETAKDPAQCR